jgi:hypothetical protein
VIRDIGKPKRIDIEKPQGEYAVGANLLLQDDDDAEIALHRRTHRCYTQNVVGTG